MMKVMISSLALLVAASGCQTDIPSIIQKSRGSLVRVNVVQIGPDKKITGPIGYGTGFAVAPGKFATAAHVVTDFQKKSIFLALANQKTRHPAKVVDYDPKHDIALLECLPLKELPLLPLHSALDDVKMGEEALVLGFPFFQPMLTATKGIVAARHGMELLETDKTLTDVFKLDASINVGNSGGPVIHVPTGKVIGIISKKAGALSSPLKAFQKKKIRGTIVVAGVDTIKLFKDILTDMENDLQLGLGYGVSVAYLKQLLQQVDPHTGEVRGP